MYISLQSLLAPGLETLILSVPALDQDNRQSKKPLGLRQSQEVVKPRSSKSPFSYLAAIK